MNLTRDIHDGERLARIEEQIKHLVQQSARMEAMLASQSKEDRERLDVISAIQQQCALRAGAAETIRFQVEKHETLINGHHTEIQTLKTEMIKIGAPVAVVS